MTFNSRARSALPSALVALLIVISGCSDGQTHAASPGSRCADLVAKAVTSYASVKGSGQCVVLQDGTSMADWQLADFTVEPAPVFDEIDRQCGYHSNDHTFTYVVSNVTDRAAGRIIELVDDSGRVRNVAKHLDHSPGDPSAVPCPGQSDSYTFSHM